MAARISFFLTGLVAVGASLSHGIAAPDTRVEREEPKQGPSAAPMGETSVPLPNRSLVDDPFERMQRKEGFGGGPSGQYQKCLDLIVVDAGEAFEAGSVWRDQGGGAPALHCIALALMELGHYGEGASRLEELAADPGAGETALRVQILSQAGNGWLLEGQARRAIAALSSGINLGREDKSLDTASLVFDRARAYALIEQWGPVFQDLTDVLAIHPRNLSALILRATAARHLKRNAQAKLDIEAAVKISPNDPAALIERAVQSIAVGDTAAARQDLLVAIVRGEKTPMTEIAQDLLAKIDVNMEGVGVPGQADDPIRRIPIEIEPKNTGPRVAKSEPKPDTPSQKRVAAAPKEPSLPEVIAEPEPGFDYDWDVPLPVVRPASASAKAPDGKGISLRTRIKR